MVCDGARKTQAVVRMYHNSVFLYRRYNVQKGIGLDVYTIFNAKNCVIWNELIAKSTKFVLTMSKDL